MTKVRVRGQPPPADFHIKLVCALSLLIHFSFQSFPELLNHSKLLYWTTIHPYSSGLRLRTKDVTLRFVGQLPNSIRFTFIVVLHENSVRVVLSCYASRHSVIIISTMTSKSSSFNSSLKRKPSASARNAFSVTKEELVEMNLVRYPCPRLRQLFSFVEGQGSRFR